MSLNFFVVRYKGKVLVAKVLESMKVSVNFSVKKDDIDEASYKALLNENDYALEYNFGPYDFIYVNYVPLERLKNGFLLYNNLYIHIESKTELCKYAKYHKELDFSKRQ